MSTIFSIGQSALSAAQVGVNTAGNNIANVSTPGYSRQQVVQTVAPSGQGTQVAEVQRVYSDYLGKQLVSSQSANSQLQTQYSQIQPIDQLLSDSTTAGLGPALQNFFDGLQDLAAAPADPVARQAVLANAEALSAGFNDLSGRLEEVGQSLNQQISSSVEQVNNAAQRLAELNQAILSSTNLNDGKPANELVDQRNQLVSDLSQQIKVTASERGGQFNLFIGNGQPLVLGSKPYSLQAVASKTDPRRTEAAYGDGTPMKADDFAGGALGGLLEFREQTLVPTQNALGRIAMGLASGMNAQHREGITLGNQAGGDFFSLPDTSTEATAAGAIRLAITDVKDIAAAAKGSAVGDNSNLLKMIDLQSAKVLDGNTRSYQSAYVQLVGQVGSKTRELEVTSTASKQIQAQAERSLQGVAGVNLDEEAANLIRYQQSYQAAGKVIQLAKQLFDTVLSISN
ncbi:flagellar hook-associated protein FlgK [Malikia sp.]|uniref:flagellar hook-associated protein FlgK n=1 Tax=Malikia sp. TaxID=2070706 RepID=UPI00261C3343|nr:flagellar hook-associated protein FlgK [Malikia sp.]MDD2727867.1 flagellar hook-associated protein FlgK [Malikia sp.]